jgi:hypothetical protein
VWVLRELVRLVARIAVCVVVALAVAGLLAVVGTQGFTGTARILCIVFGCILLALAGVGSGSNLERYADRNVTKVAWGSIPGFDPAKRDPEDPTLSPGAAFFCSGLVVIVLGILI